jgi:hypothetical protein
MAAKDRRKEQPFLQKIAEFQQKQSRKLDPYLS